MFGISTHTLTWSVTRSPCHSLSPTSYFNSHAHVERDLLPAFILPLLCISTHTLTWSVTGQLMRDYIKIGISTHTLTWSVTVLLRGYLAPVGNFNSHAHVERDRYKIMKITGVKNFNSHAHVERDYMLDTLRISNPISTHTLTWSVTQKGHEKETQMKFQLTRSRGA